MAKVALRGAYTEVVFFMGVNERYPMWFADELYNNIFMDEHRYTFWVPREERTPLYYEKKLVEDYTVFLRKPDGSIHVTDYDVFTDLYYMFRYDNFTNSGLAALDTDCIEYVECHEGMLTAGYPEWFEMFFTEAINFPPDGGSILIYDNNLRHLTATKDSLLDIGPNGDISVNAHCVFLYNKFGEIRGMSWGEFLRFYDPDPEY